jgi:hypothetical protein
MAAARGGSGMNPEWYDLIRRLYLHPDFQAWLLAHGNREQIIGWLVWNDGNGVYTDRDSELERYPHLTLQTARTAMKRVLEQL